jgi:hypothetical protein
MATRGGLEDLSIEAISADDLGAIREIPTRLGRAAAMTVWYLVMETLRGAGGNIYDGTALYTAGHANTDTVALDRPGFIAIRKKMRKQKPYGLLATAITLGPSNLPRTLWVPTSLEEMAEILTKARMIAQLASATAGGFTSAKDFLPNTELPNLAGGIDYEVVDYWDDLSTTAWFLTGDPKMVPMLEFGFWEGREDPELFTEANMTGSMFNADAVTHKIRHAHGHTVLDYRGFQKGNA